jgi:hypothetical protein
MNALKAGLAGGVTAAALGAALVLADKTPPANTAARAPVTLSETNSMKLMPLLDTAVAAPKTDAGVAVIVTCPERRSEAAYACFISVGAPGGGRRRQASVDGEDALALRGRLELAAQALRRSSAGTQSSLGRAKCPSGSVACTVSLEGPIE